LLADYITVLEEILSTLQYSILFLRSSAKLSLTPNSTGFTLLFSPGYGNDSVSNLTEFISFANLTICSIRQVVDKTNIDLSRISSHIRKLSECESFLKIISEACLDLFFTHIDYFYDQFERYAGINASSKRDTFRRYISNILNNVERSMHRAYRYYSTEGLFSSENMDKSLKYYKRKFQAERTARVSI
jgi:hypothetical protein